MSDKILLLPDNLANQIAAGEVIQRPASAVKELLENAVDAGATEVQLLITDAGKALIQVIDNGSGMSETDARMCFERHATSKIKDINDLFHIKTMGFRGEALASIAAVSQVELKTKRADDDWGTYLLVENSAVQVQEPVACPNGTSIAMKNLFFNVPARRNFLKSNAAEMRHIIDEFTRVAMAHPAVQFTLNGNGQQLFFLEQGSLKQRITQLLGNHYQSKLVTVKDETDYLNIHGFVGKPETAKKTRGDQYFFVNNRFIKSAYLNHAVMNAYKELIPAENFPMYVLFIELDPAQVDVNVHPTKQEIKFEDEKLIYAFVQASVKHALAQFSVSPTLNFDLDTSIQHLPAVQQPFTDDKRSAASSGSLYKGFIQKNQAHFIEKKDSHQGLGDWQDFYTPTNVNTGTEPESAVFLPSETVEIEEVFQLLKTYIVVHSEKGFRMINQRAAHERILFEKYNATLSGKAFASQSLLFPVTLELSPVDAILLAELTDDLQLLGYQLAPFGKDTYIMQGVPADLDLQETHHAIDLLLEQYKHFNPERKVSQREKLIRSFAKQEAVKTGVRLTEREMKQLVTDLYKCEQPNLSPDGNPTFLEFDSNQLEQMFGL